MKNRLRMRIGAVLLALVMSVSALPPPARAAESLESFEDLTPGEWYEQGIRFCLHYGLMDGSDGRVRRFEPDEPLTRAQLVTILWRMEGKPVIGLTMQYTDVPDKFWYADAVRWAHATGVMDGYTLFTFAPNDPVTREQLATILWNYAKYHNEFVPTVSNPEFETFRDHDKVSDYAVEAMRWANGLGIINGVRNERGEDVLIPWKISSRAVTATILMRFCLDMGIFD